MMRKVVTIWVAFSIAFALPAMAAAFGGVGTKSLCEFPFGRYGNFQVKYDLRIYHHDYFHNSYPNGGIKLEFYVGGFPTAAERDTMVDKILWVRFTNKTNGDTHLITRAMRYKFLDISEDAEYAVWIGQKNGAAGLWDMVVATKMGRYTASFEIKEETDLQQPHPVPSDDILIIEDPSGWNRVLSWEFDSEDIRLSVIDGWDFIHRSRWVNTLPCLNEGERCTTDFYYPAELNGKTARIEHRNYGKSWPILINDGVCEAYNMKPGGQSRASYYITLEPTVPVDCTTETLGSQKYVEVKSPDDFSCLGSVVCVDHGGMPQWTDPPAGCEQFNACGGTARLPEELLGQRCNPDTEPERWEWMCGPHPDDIFCANPDNPPWLQPPS